MSLPIDFTSEALDDLDGAFLWYEKERAGLGEEFLAAVLEHFAALQENPETNEILFRKVRACLVRRFKYVIYYRLLDDRINVIAVQHGHRNPRAWRRRT